jgi:adenosylcobinamide-phosphate synthase
LIGQAMVLAGALSIDWLAGEYPAFAHPVVWMGWATKRLERALFRGDRARQLLAGSFVTLVIPSGFAASTAWLMAVLRSHPVLSAVVATCLVKSTFALRALGRAGINVATALERGDLDAARQHLRSLCSRDPSTLDSSALVAASVESLAENLSDSFVAPLFYLALFGLPGAIFYRAVNTLDAMIGYHGRYEYFGKAAARLDDLLNLIPARITALLILVTGKLDGHDLRRGTATLIRDHARTESPNAGWPMAAMAGLLGLELTKAGAYRLGDAINPLEPGAIRIAWRVAAGAGFLAVAVILVFKGYSHGR